MAAAKLHLRIPVATCLTLVLAAVGGCGGGPHTRGGGAARHPGARQQSATGTRNRHPYYRWLVPTTGAPPSILAENHHHGTRAWRLPGPASDIGGLAWGTVRGYPAQETVSPGDLQRIYVSAPGAGWVRIAIFRMGWYHGSGGREVFLSRRLGALRQPPCHHQAATGLTECAWRPSLSFRIPPALPSGVFIAKVSARTGASDVLFVVGAHRPTPLLAQLPTATYEAYNAWGGDSLYPGGADRVGLTGTTQGVEVSYERPYDSVTGAGQFFARDVAMIRFLERYGIPVSYTTSESVDEQPGQLLPHRGLLDFGHSEYWSGRQVAGFAQARDHGSSLLFLSSDTIAWRVRFARASRFASEPRARDHTIIAYKEHAALDPDRARPTGSFGAAAAALTGSEYLGCITPRLRQSGPPTYRLYPWVPISPLRPGWLFSRSGLRSGHGVPGIVGYEPDARAPATPIGTRLVARSLTACMSTGGAESGVPRRAPGSGVADATLYRAHSGALVFASGTLGWELGLEPVPSASPDAPRKPEPALVRITRNLLARVLRHP